MCCIKETVEFRVLYYYHILNSTVYVFLNDPLVSNNHPKPTISQPKANLMLDYSELLALAAKHNDRCLALFIGSLMHYRGRGVPDSVIMDKLQALIKELDKASASGYD